MVRFYPDAGAFGCRYGVILPQHIRFRLSRGTTDADWPYEDAAILYADVFHPDRHPEDQTGLFPYRWRPPYTDWDRFPAQFAAAWEQITRDLDRWSALPSLVEQLRISPRRPGTFWGLPPDRAVAIALFEAGPSQDLHAALAELDSGDKVRMWIESELRASTDV